MHEPQRMPVELGDLLARVHDLLQRPLDGLPEGVRALLVPGAEEEPPGARHPALELGCLGREDLEADPGAAVGGADVDLLALADLQRRGEPLRGVPVVLSADRRGVGLPEGRRRVVELDVGRERHAVPEDDAVHHAVFRRDEVQVGLAAHLHLAFGEIKLEDLMDWPKRPPRLAESLIIHIGDLIEGAKTGVISGAPIEAVCARPSRADDLARGTHDCGTHGHHHMA
mmetsp:Transcript_10594/g.29882  ORF Transcript_10594/g.29882 Transcript_10594/m.29882 type:complete len:227 (+) Transcript_10594:1271-1951(+)